MARDIYSTETLDADFDKLVLAAELKTQVSERMRTAFDHTWQLKALLTGLEKAGYQYDAITLK